MSATIETDYLVIGAGATALAFVDTLLDETDANVVIVDRYDQPGGHWRVAYDFVRLHQPADFYGVNSRLLGSSVVEGHGLNAGMLSLSSRDEVRAYFEAVVRERFVPSGRVQYLPKTEYDWSSDTARGIVSGETTQFVVRRKTVDSTYMKVTVPAMQPPLYRVDPGVRIVPPNALSSLAGDDEHYVVVGGGKTGIDTVLWLLERGLDPDRITWVRPRDAWLFNREWCQPGPQFAAIADRYAGAFANAWLQAESLPDLLDQLIDAEWLLRISDDVRPTAFRCATVTRAELAQLQRVHDVTSHDAFGRVRALRPGVIEFENGARPVSGDPLYIDCSANGLARLESVPVFNHARITLQSVLLCQQVYSAAFIAHIESRGGTDAEKNALTRPAPHPESEIDFLRTWLDTFRNDRIWADDPEIVEWRQRSRLAGLTTNVGTPLPPAGPERDAALAQYKQFLDAVIPKAEEMIEAAENSRLSVTVGGQ
ncbi:hypothetical protein BA059_27105 [Mycolicibacterium sp. (ex Dasyatis americana)]|nr:hypothetical protein BA059_27105 [Mycolicibacterium sp. (ex Dasyatis americana)]